MRIVIIGGSGHVGTYLVPRLVAARHTVVVLSRGQRAPYQPHAAWQQVEQIAIDRETEEAAGTFGRRVRDLKPDAVIDMICFTLASAQQLVEALRDEVGHFLHCGTIWVHGPSVEVPTTEAQPSRPFGAYGEQKAAIERTYSTKPAATTSRPRRCTPATSLALAGRRSTPSATSTSRSSADSLGATNSFCPISAWKPCITFTPTTWPRHSSALSTTGTRL